MDEVDRVSFSLHQQTELYVVLMVNSLRQVSKFPSKFLLSQLSKNQIEISQNYHRIELNNFTFTYNYSEQKKVINDISKFLKH